MRNFYEKVVNHPKLILTIYAVLFVICLFTSQMISVNYDMNDYFPEDSASTTALDVMDKEFDGGTSEYTSGVATVAANYDKIFSGTKEISSGSKNLVSGTESLKSGSSTLYNGISSLCDGTAELSDGTKEFYEQASDAHSTADEKIDEILASIKGGDGDPYSFVSSKNTNVSSVQFVIKTDAIEKPEEKKVEKEGTEETSFWDKLVNLFTGFFG